MKKFRINHNEKGFTLIELMIVIAIIGILSAIAIPNFISYRNKSFCSGAESDANSIAAAVADYFAIPTNVSITKASLEATGVDANLSNLNTWGLGGDIDNIEITITDASGRCPLDYQAGLTAALNPRGYWSQALGGNYIKTLAN